MLVCFAQVGSLFPTREPKKQQVRSKLALRRARPFVLPKEIDEKSWKEEEEKETAVLFAFPTKWEKEIWPNKKLWNRCG